MLLWLVNTYLPMDGKIKKILNVVMVVAIVLWLLAAFGIFGYGGDIRVSQVRSKVAGAMPERGRPTLGGLRPFGVLSLFR